MTHATHVPHPVPDSLTVSRRIVIGAAGGLAPIALNLLVVDLTTVFSSPQLLAVLAWLVRAVVLCVVGGLVAWLHAKEHDPWKLFQLGIVAPALITAGMNGGAATQTIGDGSAPPIHIGSIFMPDAALAQDLEEEILSFDHPEETSGQALWRGFTGIRSRDRWFVLLRWSSKEQGVAVEKAKWVRETYRTGARVYEREFGEDRVYYVALQAWVPGNRIDAAIGSYAWTKLDLISWYAP